MSKLQNVKAVQELLQGNHKTQTRTTIGYDKQKDTKKREVGEIWEEVLPGGHVVQWEQKKGYKVKTSKSAAILRDAREYLENYPKCYDDCSKKTTKEYTRLDKRFRVTHGMCFDCVLKMEAKLQIEGKYEEYEKQKMRANVESFIKDIEIEKEYIKESLNEIKYVHVDGRAEEWKLSNKETFLKRVDDDFEKLKEDLIKDYT